jgi:hypothetical protein
MTDANATLRRQILRRPGAAVPGLVRTTTLLCSAMTCGLVLPFQGDAIVAAAVPVLAEIKLIHGVLLLWTINAFLVLRIGLRFLPRVPAWLVLALLGAGGAMVVGPAAPAVALVLGTVHYTLRHRRRTALEARLAQRLSAAG